MDKYLSKKEYLNKYDSNVGYALYVQNNIKRDDYVRLNTGEIVKVIGIKENELNKKSIYFGIYEQDWFDSMAVENFSDKIIDLIEVGDYVNGMLVKEFSDADGNMFLGFPIYAEALMYRVKEVRPLDTMKIKSIVTHEQFESIEYKVEEDKQYVIYKEI